MYNKDASGFEVRRTYRHFKGNFYYVIDIALHTETMEKMVIYQALYGEYKTFVRPYSMFIELVPENKENPTMQIYRFEQMDLQ